MLSDDYRERASFLCEEDCTERADLEYGVKAAHAVDECSGPGTKFVVNGNHAIRSTESRDLLQFPCVVSVVPFMSRVKVTCPSLLSSPGWHKWDDELCGCTSLDL